MKTKTVGKVLIEEAKFDCTCCKGKYFDEVILYRDGSRERIHMWKILDSIDTDDQHVDRRIMLGKRQYLLQKVF